MKAATGELNLTLITVVAIGAILALFSTILWPNIKNKLTKSTNDFGNSAGQNFVYNIDFTDYVETELF